LRGVVSKYDEGKSRFEVRCASGSPASLKAASLRKLDLVPCESGGDAQSWCAAAERLSHKPGVVVEVSGLESEGGRGLNGQRGIVGSYDKEKGRFVVHLAAGNPVNLKPENLRRLAESHEVVSIGGGADSTNGFGPASSADTAADVAAAPAAGTPSAGPTGETPAQLPLAAGDFTEVFGLTSEGGRPLNGQKGVVSRYVEETRRFEVQLVQKLVSLKSENLRKLTDGERLVSVQSQIFEAVDRPEVEAQINELRASCKNMRQYGPQLERLLEPIRQPIYERHGVDREWHRQVLEEIVAQQSAGTEEPEVQRLEESMQDLCAFGGRAAMQRSEHEASSTTISL